MFSRKLKQQISEQVQAILQETGHDELPEGEIQFLLHVDGKEGWSWANIRNESAKDKPVARNLIGNESVAL